MVLKRSIGLDGKTVVESSGSLFASIAIQCTSVTSSDLNERFGRRLYTVPFNAFRT